MILMVKFRARTPSGGNYWSDYVGIDVKSGPNQDQPEGDGIGDISYMIDASNTDSYPRMLPYKGHDDVVVGITADRTVTGQGFIQKIDVAVSNVGSFPQTFGLTAYANGAEIQTLAVKLIPRNATTARFYWTLQSSPTVTATLLPTLGPVPQETGITDDMVVDGWVLITIAGDVDGDRDVDIFDIVMHAWIVD